MWHSTLVHLLLFACVGSVHSHPLASLSDSAGSSKPGQNLVDLYNVCPVLVKFTEEQELLSERELNAKAADAAMTAYLLSHPKKTLWDYFRIEWDQKSAMFKNLPLSEKVKKVLKDSVDFVSDTTILVVQMIADAVEWIIHTLHHPRVGMRQVSEFFHKFGQNVMTMHGLLMKEPKRTFKNVVGGTFLFIRHHPSEFTSNAIVLLGSGFASMHGLLMGVYAVFGSFGVIVSNVLMGMMLFMHMIDIPVLLITPFISSFAKTAQILSGKMNNATSNSTGLSFNTVQPTDACLIPVQYRPTFSPRDMCLGTSPEVRMLLFGTAKRSIDMDDNERVYAFNHFHDFVCCYLTDQEFEVNVPNATAIDFEATLVPMPVKMTDCDKLLGVHNAKTAWRAAPRSDNGEEL
uniref:Uncharacterized protein n=1 Tax=Peronospora matthiolae TaxID=2874970 RepID=A0AAV1T744_9STRA